MISHRLRAAVAGVPIVLMSGLLVASPALAADALRITSPIAGSTVSGALVVEGSVAGDGAVDIELGLAPQVLGDCGNPAASVRVDDVVGSFSASIPTDGLADGAYCVYAVGDSGRLSSVVADVTLNNAITAGESIDGFQLSTEALGAGGDAGHAASAAPLAAPTALGELPVLGAAVLALTVALAAVVLGTGLWARRRTAA